jgi:putative transposase
VRVAEVLGYEYIDCSYPNEGDGVVRVEYSTVPCKYCGSTTGIVRFGTYKGTQQLWCKKCRREFADNQAIPGMRTPTDQVGMALLDFYSGDSLNDIRVKLTQQFQNSPSDSSIYGWVTRFSKVAVDKTKNLQPKVGDVWLADETVLQIAGKNIWFWDVMDAKTRFLLASHMSASRSSNDAESLMRDAAKRAGKSPRVVITDKLLAYVDGIERAFGSDTTHVQSHGFTVQPNTNLIERLHGSIKDRTKVMRGLKSIPSAYLFMDAWATHYNFIRVHDTLKKTPAEEAGLASPFKDWLEVAREPQKAESFDRYERGGRKEAMALQAARQKPRKHSAQKTVRLSLF